jgi:membrane protease YdiL (CAAX protease family)
MARTAPAAADHRPALAAPLVLLGLLALLGLAAPLWAGATWVALALYVCGSPLLTLAAARGGGAWRDLSLAGPGWRSSLAWGLGLGAGLAAVAWLGMGAMGVEGSAAGGAAVPMAAMAELLFGQRLVFLLPLLVVAEEFLWRGLLPAALTGRGIGEGAALALTTLGYALVHLAVAPVPLAGRAMMAAMALPLGLLAGFLTVRTGSLWGAVALHLLVMGSMVAMLL